MKQRNGQDIELTKTECGAHGKVVLSGNRAVENDDNEAASQVVEDVISKEIEVSEEHSTV